jgi:hypothetical protein
MQQDMKKIFIQFVYASKNKIFGNFFNFSPTYRAPVFAVVNLFGTLITAHLMRTLSVDKTSILGMDITNTT